MLKFITALNNNIWWNLGAFVSGLFCCGFSALWHNWYALAGWITATIFLVGKVLDVYTQGAKKP